MSNPIIETHNLTKIFEKGLIRKSSIVAVKNVSLTIEEGETFCLIGPNGAGKTTLIRMLLDFIKPSAGSAQLFGQANTIPSLRDAIGYFPERVKYPPRLTVNQYLTYWGQFSGLEGTDLLSRVYKLLGFVRLEDNKNTVIKNLSKGMAVRVGIAQALLGDPKLLIFDEPTDGLDPLGRIEFRDMLKELKSEGKTILINSHLLSEVEQISTKVGIMDKGELIRIDTMENLISMQQQVTIYFQCTSTDAISRLKEKFVITSSGSDWILTLSNSQTLDDAIKCLASVGATIQNIDKAQNVLESKFLSLIKQRA